MLDQKVEELGPTVERRMQAVVEHDRKAEELGKTVMRDVLERADLDETILCQRPMLFVCTRTVNKHLVQFLIPLQSLRPSRKLS